MSAPVLPGLSRPAYRLVAAVLAIVFTLALVPASGLAAKASTPKASAAAVRVELRSVDRRRAQLRTLVARACRGGHPALCKSRRARLRAANARAARLRRSLGSSTTRRKTKSGSTSTSSTTTTTSGSTTSTKSPAGTTTTAKPTTQSVPTGPAASTDPVADTASTATFQPGINSGGWLQYDLPATKRLGAKQVRVEFPVNETVAQLRPTIEGYANAGIRVLPLAGFAGRMPSAAEAQNLASWAAAYGPGGSFWAGRTDGDLAVRLIEFGNETSAGYQYGDGYEDESYRLRARTYAQRLRDAVQAIRATDVSVGVLSQVDDWTGTWVDNLYAAVPEFHQYVAGWTSHPYGSGWKSTLEQAVRHTSEHGAPATIPVDITEWGVATDNGTCLDDNYGLDKCMTYAAAATVMHDTIAAMKTYLKGRLRSFMMYQVRDQDDPGVTQSREAYFGLQTKGLQDKGAYTAQARVELAATS